MTKELSLLYAQDVSCAAGFGKGRVFRVNPARHPAPEVVRLAGLEGPRGVLTTSKLNFVPAVDHPCRRTPLLSALMMRLPPQSRSLNEGYPDYAQLRPQAAITERWLVSLDSHSSALKRSSIGRVHTRGSGGGDLGRTGRIAVWSISRKWR